MACLPNDTLDNGSTGWIAYAYTNHWLSVYRGPWCSYPSVQMHEIGHNLNLAHSGEGNRYDDQSGMVSNIRNMTTKSEFIARVGSPRCGYPKMGYSYSSDEGPVMCFNGPKNWQLQWYSDRHVDLSNGVSWTGSVYGISAYENSSTGDAVVVRINEIPNVYVSYNKKDGINSGTKEGGDQLLVHTKAAGANDFGVSVLVAKLNPGEEFTTGSNNRISFVSSGGDFALVQVEDIPSPTPSPTANPTPSPTNNPTASPTKDCRDDPDFYWQNKNCEWFGGKKDFHCYKKAGAIEGCPLSCGTCNLSDAVICGNSNISQVACEAATMCNWIRSTRQCVVA